MKCSKSKKQLCKKKHNKKQSRRRLKKTRKNGGGDCGCEKTLYEKIFKGGNNLGDTKYYYGVNDQNGYNLPESSSLKGGKKKNRKTRKMKGGMGMPRSYDNYFLNMPDMKGMQQTMDVVNGKTILSSAPYEQPLVENQQNPIA